MNELRAILRGALPALARRYHILSLGPFGSTVRGEARPDSDVDILVEFNDTPGLLRFIELENDLSDLLAARGKSRNLQLNAIGIWTAVGRVP